MSDHQHALLRRTFERAASREAEIVAATDNEPAGESLAEEIQNVILRMGGTISVSAKRLERRPVISTR